MTDNEITTIMLELHTLSGATLRARGKALENPGYKAAQVVQKLQRQASDLRATLPKLRIV